MDHHTTKTETAATPTTPSAGKFMQANSVQKAPVKKAEWRRTQGVSSRQAEALAM